jgi:hypothetical protein
MAALLHTFGVQKEKERERRRKEGTLQEFEEELKFCL